ncbi:metallophosphoesterase family protein [Leptospira ilyithenensis]|uniref:Phosphohydrolase n=1 Tax=Leptospira ilyithenensis TaxID=2484901 RepID=A0A4R9LSN3_9LEPT|nr:metallophosphoesterase family protein [Leptospira ilyithenensis]TGN11683.1 phosphohydrolase [Leptospira ilyithenensis]
MKIVHISDLHFPTKIPFSSLRGKSVIGYLNYAVRRQKKYPPVLIETLIQTIEKLEYDALIISGDLTNVSHPSEFPRAKEWLKPILDDRTFIIPGNHDRYKKESVQPVLLFEKEFAPFLGEEVSKTNYLRKKEIGGFTLIGWDSNRPLPIAKANGSVRPEIISETNSFVNKPYVLVCHHPLWNPKFQEESNGHKMVNRKEVASLLKEKPPVLYLHGHTHTNWIKRPGEKAPFYVVNSASSTRLSDSKHISGFHIIDLNGNGKAAFRRFSYHTETNQFLESPLLIYDEEDGVI